MDIKKLELSGLELADPDVDYSIENQIFYIDFDGAENVSYDNDALGIHIDNITVQDSGLTEEQQFQIITELNDTFAGTGVYFTMEVTENTVYSTIFVGETDAFSDYGNFQGLAETIDIGNKTGDDDAFVFSDKIDSTATITETITHEAAHLIGFQHEGSSGNSLIDFAVITQPVTGVTKITASDGVASDEFGESVAISGQNIVIGAIFDSSDNAYVYRWNGTSYDEIKLVASDGGSLINFGCSVAMDGDIIVVGAYDRDNYNGGAYVYQWNGSSYDETILEPDGSFCGFTVGVSGENIIVSDHGANDNGSYTGAAHVYRWNGTGYDEIRLTASDGAENDFFGYAVAIDGDTAVVGAYGDDSERGSVYVYKWNGLTYDQTKITASDGAAGSLFGISVAVDGDNIAVGASEDDSNGDDSGKAYVYRWNGSSYDEYILAASDAAAGDEAGYTVAISGDYVIFGAENNDDGGADSGSAYVFKWNGSSYEETKLAASDAGAGDNFGYSVSISGTTVLVGAKGDDDNGTDSGSVYVYDLSVYGDETAPQVPIGLTDEVSGNSVTLDWNDATDDQSGVSEYVVELADNDTFAGVISQTVTISELNLGGLTDLTTYYWRVKAIDNAGNESDWSSVDSFNIDIPDTEAPDVPTGLSDSVTADSVTLDWADSTDNKSGVKEYVVEYADNYFYTDSVSQTVVASELNLSSLTGGAYYWRVKAIDNAGNESAWSTTDCFLPYGVTKFLASDGAADDKFGYSVAISGGNFVAGAMGDNSSTGSAYVYRWNGTSYDEYKLTASDGVDNEYFGEAIAIDVDTVVIGVNENESVLGRAYVFQWNGSSYDETIITASDGFATDHFGKSVAVAGDTVVVGSVYDDDAGYNAGSAYVFHWNGTTYDETKLTASDSSDNDRFGETVAILDDTIVVGAPHDDDRGTDSGSVYVYTWNGTSYDELKLTAWDGADMDRFGGAIAIDGGVVVVGSEYNYGNAYAYRWNGTSYDEYKLIASDGNEGDGFGASVAIDGDTIIIGAAFNDNSGTNSGSAYIYRWNGISYYEEAKLTAPDGATDDCFGRSVAINGDTVVIGATYDDDTGDDSGSAYVFELNEVLDRDIEAPDMPAGLTQQVNVGTVLLDWTDSTDNIAGSGIAGYIVELADNTGFTDAFSLVVVSSEQALSGWNDGSYYWRVKAVDNVGNESDWSTASTFIVDDPGIDTGQLKLIASDGGMHNYFGESVSISGDTIVVGAPYDYGTEVDPGNAYVYRWNGISYSEYQITASDGINENWFGCSVAVDDDLVVVGTRCPDSAVFGSAYVYRWNYTAAAYDEYILSASDGAANDYFGATVAVDGETVVVGAFFDDDNDENSGSVYVYTWNGTSYNEVKLTASDGAADDRFGNSVAIDGGTIVVGATGDDNNTGSAYVYKWNGSGYDERKLTASNGEAYDNFGDSVDVDGDVVVVGADCGVYNSGNAYAYRWNGTSYDEYKLDASNELEAYYLGSSVAVCGDFIVVGAAGIDNGYGAVYIYHWNGITYDNYKLISSDIAAEDDFGRSVSIDGTTVVVGAYKDDDNGEDSGSAYIFDLNNIDFIASSIPAGLTDTVANATASLDWSDSTDNEAGVKEYIVEYADNDTFTGAISLNSLNSELELASLGDGIYYWRVKSVDNNGNSSAWSSIDSFLIDVTPPDVPENLSQSVEALSVFINWNDSSDDGSGLKEYVVEYADNDQFTDATSQTVAASELTLNGLSYGTYYWRVKSVDNYDNESDWSSVDSFAYYDTGTFIETTKLLASNGGANLYFGFSVAIDGDLIAVGSTSCGYIYQLDGGVWSESTISIPSLYAAINGDDALFRNKVVQWSGSSWEIASFFVPVIGMRSINMADNGIVVNGNLGASLHQWNGSTWDATVLLDAETDSISQSNSIAFDGETIVVGVDGDDTNGSDAGCVYIYQWNGSSWEETTLYASDAAEGDRFGYSVAADGDTIVVGSVYADSESTALTGCVYVYKWNGSNWDETKISASDGAGMDLFGTSVSIDGNSILVGAKGDDDNGNMSGSAYVYQWNGSGWNEAKLIASDGQAGDFFGFSVAIDGDKAVIGSYDDDDNGENSGSAYVFDLNDVIDLVAPSVPAGLSYSFFHKTISLDWSDSTDEVDGTGFNEYIIEYSTGADFAVSTSQAVAASELVLCGLANGTYYWRVKAIDNASNESDWSTVESFTVSFPTMPEGQIKLYASDGASSDGFGFSVALDGNTVVVGGHGNDDSGENSGSAYVYRWDGSAYVEHKLTASDGESGDWFGRSVAIEEETIIIGAVSGNSENIDDTGCVYVYSWNGSAYDELKLTASDGATGDAFGWSVALDGGTVVVGAQRDNDSAGSAYVYSWNGSAYDEYKLVASDATAGDLFGYSAAIDGETIVVGALGDDENGDGSGSAYVYRWNGVSYDELKLIASDGVAGDAFGKSVAVDGGNVVVGASGSRDSAYVYRWNGSSYDEYKLSGSNSGTDNNFGISVAINGDIVAVGASSADESSGNVFIYRWNGVSYSEYNILAYDGFAGDFFGISIAIEGENVIVGATGDDGSLGSAYVFIDYIAPSTPAGLSESIVERNVTLDWNDSIDDGSGLKEYIVEYGTAADFTGAVSVSVAVSNLELTDLAEGIYYWRVKSVDNNDNESIWTIGGNIAIDTTAPAVPAGLTDNVTDDSATLDWNDAVDTLTGTKEYIVEYADNDQFTDATSQITAISELSLGALVDGTYYWRVKSVDNSDNASAWSETDTFYIDTTASSAPGTLSFVVTDNDVVLDWADSTDNLSGVAEYVVEYTTGADFSASNNRTAAVSDLTLTDLAEGVYHWRVKSVDNNGNESDWTVGSDFTVDVTAPDVPVGLTGSVTGNSVSLDWNDSSDNITGVREYLIEYTTAADFIGATSISSANSDLNLSSLGDGVYHWRVKAVDNNGNESAWTNGEDFTVDTTAPDVPATLSSIVTDNDVALDWIDSADNVTGTSEYIIQYTTAADFAGATSTNSATSDLDLSDLADGVYHWRVKAVDNNGNETAWTNGSDFTIDTTAPDVPNGLSDNVTDDSAALDWNDSGDNVSGVKEYVVEYADNLSFTGATSQTVTLSELDLTSLSDGTYYWHVKAVDNSDNESGWSGADNFTVDTTSPTLPSGLTETVVGNDVSLDWGDSGDATTWVDHYIIEYATTADFSGAVSQTVTASTIDLTDLADGVYHWRVQAFDAKDNASDWVGGADFTIDITAPDVPASLEASVTDNDVALDWSESADNVTGTKEYIVEYSTAADFSGATSQTVTAGTLDLTDLSDGVYHWRVKAVDNNDNESAWSSGTDFTIDITAPDVPGSLDASVSENDVSLDWDDSADNVTGTKEYVIEYTIAADFSGATSQTVTAGTLDLTDLSDGVYHWRVKAVDNNDNESAWSNGSDFTVDITAPDVPSSPDASVTGNDVALDWADSTDNVTGIKEYVVEYTTAADFGGATSVNSMTSNLDLTGLVDGVYHWRVKAVDNNGNETVWTNGSDFTVDITAPAIPDGLTDSVSNDHASLDWNDSSDNIVGIKEYVVEYANNDQFDSSTILTVTDSEQTLDGLSDLTTYYWRVKAVDNHDNASAWSLVESFFIDIPDTQAPDQPSALSCVVTANSADLDWSDAGDNKSGLKEYVVEYADNSDYTGAVSQVVNDSEITLNSLSDMTIYYWRVKAIDNAGNETAWADSSFAVNIPDTQAPDIPAGLTEIVTGNEVIFDWDDSTDNKSGLKNYLVEYADNSSFTDAVSHSVTVSELDIAGLSDGIYYWRVKAVDNNNNESVWTNGSNFTVDITAPDIPSALDASVTGNDVAFDWSDSTDNVTGMKEYVVEYTTAVDFSGAVGNSTATSNLDLTGLDDGVYHWRIKSVDNNSNESDWTSGVDFTIDITAPDAPSSLDVSVINNDVTLDWGDSADNVSGTKEYVIEYTTAADFSGAVNSASAISALDLIDLADGVYHWRVKSIDNNGNESAWTIGIDFTVDATAPDAPVVLTGNVTDNSVALDWNDSFDNITGTKEYVIEYTTAVDFSAATSIISATSNLDLTDLPDGIYHWRVKAVDNNDNESAWADGSDFTVDITAPDVPANMSFNVTGNDVALDWGDSVDNVTGTKEYVIEYTTAADFIGAVSISSATSDLDLFGLVDATYHWRVKAVDNNGNVSEWTDGDDFTVDINAPAIPAGLSDSVIADSALLDWSDSNDPGIKEYVVEYADNENFILAINQTTVVSELNLNSLADGTYYWRVKAVDIHDNASTWSSKDSFYVDTTAPDVPSGLTGVVASDNVSLDWTDSVDNLSGTKEYVVEYANNEAFTSSVFQVVSDSTLDLTDFPDGIYYWRVKAIDNNDNASAWSVTNTFVVDVTAPDIPALLSLTVAGNNVDLDWSDSIDNITGTNEYIVEYTTAADFTAATGISTAASDLNLIDLVDGVYHWRVKSVDVNGNASAWISGADFTIDITAPESPASLVASVTDNDVDLDWTDSVDNLSGTKEYVVEYANNEAFTSSVFQVVSDSNLYLSSLADGIYYWRVKAIDNNDNASARSDGDCFIVDITEPSAPTGLAGSVNNDSAFLDWNDSGDDVSGLKEYIVEYADNDQLTGAVSQTVLTSELNISNLVDGTYYWRVKAVDNNDNQSDWSIIDYFIVDLPDTQAPGVPDELTDSVNGDSVLLDWSDSTDDKSGIKEYVVEFADNDQFTPANGYYVTSSELELTDLTDMTTYYWRVKAIDNSNNESTWSAVGSFTVDIPDSEAPSVPIGLIGNVTDDTVSLDWDDSADNKSGLKEYIVEYADNDQLDGAVSQTVQSSELDISNLVDGTYYWRVKAVDNNDNQSDWSIIDYFTIDIPDTQAPGVPDGLTDSVNGDSVSLDWSDSTDNKSGVKEYVVEFANNDQFTFAISNYVTSSELELADLTDMTTYYWRVKAIDNSYNESAWSETAVFSIDIPDTTAPDVPTGLSDSVIETDATLDWDNSTDNKSGVREYIIEYATNSMFTNAVSQTVTSSEFELSSLTYGNYFWRVKAIDNEYNESAWSTVDSFQVMPSGVTKLVASDGMEGDFFGCSVAVSGYNVVVGAQNDDNNENNSGSAYVYRWNDTTGWYDEYKLSLTDEAENVYFGYSVAVSGDVVAAGARYMAWVYRWNGTDYDETILGPSSPGKSFLYSVAVDDDTVVVGTMGTYIYSWNGSSYDELQLSSVLGYSVAVSDNTVVAGNPFGGDENTGSAYAYRWNDATGIYDEYALAALDGEAGDSFGNSVAASGDNIVVGARNNDNNSGGAYVYRWDGTDYEEYKLTVPDGLENSLFGYSVAIDGDIVVVGTMQNLAVIYSWNGISYDIKYTLTAPDGTAGFGYSVSIDGDIVTVGARYDNDNGSGSGSVYVFDMNELMDLIAPDIPTGLVDSVTDADVLLDWEDSGDNTGGVGLKEYVIEYADNETFTDAITQTVVSSTFNISDLADGTYYWHVKAVDNADNNSDWSQAASFVIDSPDTQAPSIPAGLEVSVTGNIASLDWEDAIDDKSGVSRYYVLCADNAAFSGAFLRITLTSEIELTELTDGTYYWKVRAIDNSNNLGLFSATETFVIDTTAPDAPSELSVSIEGNEATIDWADSSDSLSGLNSYTVEYMKSGSATIYSLTSAVSESILNNLIDGIYHWRVKAVDNSGNETSLIYGETFIIDTTAPMLPSGLSAITDDGGASLFWNASVDNLTGINEYIVEYTADSNFDSPYSLSVTTSEIDLTDLPDGIYHWRVKAIDGNGNNSEWVNGNDFSVDSDDQISEATVIDEIPVVIQGSINNLNDVDIFAISVNAGDTIDFATSSRSDDDVDTYLRLFDSNGVMLASNDNNGNDYYSKLRYSFADSGVYYLGVSGYGNYSYDALTGEGDVNGDTGDFALSVSRYVPEDYNDQILEAALVTCDNYYVGGIDPDTDVDMYKITVAAEDTLGFMIQSDNGTCLRIFDSAGVELAIDDNGVNPDNSLYLEYHFDIGGTYYFGISGSGNDSYGAVDGTGDTAGNTSDFILQVSLIASAAASIDDTIADAVAIDTQSSTMQSISTATDVDMYSFEVEAGQMISFDIDRRSSDFDSWIRIFDGNGIELDFNDDGAAPGEGSSRDSYLEYLFDAGGTYYVGVSGWGNDAYNALDGSGDVGGISGDYTLILDELGVFDLDDEISEAVNIAVGQTVYDELDSPTASDVDMFAFYVEDNQSIAFDIDRSGSASLDDSWIRIFDAAGNELAFNDNAAAAGESVSNESYLEYIFVDAGTYYIGVSGYQNASYSALDGSGDVAGSEGEYSLTLTDISGMDDEYENNDTFATAYDLLDASSGLNIYDLQLRDTADWFKFSIDHQGQLGDYVAIDFNNGLGDLDLKLFDSTGNLIDFSATSQNGETISLSGIAAGDYFVQIYGNGGACNSDYDLVVNMTPYSEPSPADQAENYAVLFSGGANASANYSRYYDNISGIYEALINNYGLDADNIYILYADGNDPGIDQGTINSDMSFASGSTVLSATGANLESVFSTLGGIIDDNDHFFFYSYDHGAQASSGKDYLCGWNDFISDTLFADWASYINAGYETYVMAQCYAGGMIEDLTLDANEFACSSSNNSEVAWSGHPYGFAGHFLEGLQSGYNSTYDLFAYANTNDLFSINNPDYIPLYSSSGELAIEHPQSMGDDFQLFASVV